jgi:hypothetical protein
MLRIRNYFNSHTKQIAAAFGIVVLLAMAPFASIANPWNGKVVFQAFWWDLQNQNYPRNWYTYLAKLAPRLRQLGIDGMWIPSPAKGASGGFSMGIIRSIITISAIRISEVPSLPSSEPRTNSFA